MYKEIYNNWLNSGKLTEVELNELKNIKDEKLYNPCS